VGGVQQEEDEAIEGPSTAEEAEALAALFGKQVIRRKP
jgi:hypothetical protein